MNYTASEERWYRNHYGSNWQNVMAEDKRKKAEGQQKKDIAKPFQEAMAYYKAGGGFGKGVEAQLERGRTRSMASGMNALIGSGLAGTTVAAGLGKKYEEEVAAPTMAGVESTRAEQLANLKIGLAGAQQQSSEFIQNLNQQAAQSQQSLALQKYMANLQAQGQAGQLGLGYAQLGAGRQQAAGQLGLGYAELQAKINAQNQPITTGNNNFRVPVVAPSLFSSEPTITPGQKMNLGWSSAELTALNKKLGNKTPDWAKY